MSIVIKINTVDKTSDIEQDSVVVVQRLTSLVDTALFRIKNTPNRSLYPVYRDVIEIYDGSTKIFGGTVSDVESRALSGAGGELLIVRCVEYTYDMDNKFASKTYSSQTIKQIIDDLISTYAPTFTTTNVTSSFTIEKIVFNQVPLSVCLKRLADIVQYDWYVDENKDVHFFSKFANTAPFDLTDTNGNYVYKSLRRMSDGAQVVNRIKVRGGEYNGTSFTDKIVVNGNDTKSFKLPYRFANLVVKLNTVTQDVGIDFIDDFTSDDVLFNFQEKTIRWETALSDADVIEFTGTPKVPVFAISEDVASIAAYGTIEKLVRDNSIESNTVARKRANAELYSYAEPIIDAKFFTQTSGLRTGMLINAQSTERDFDDDLLIKTITFKQIGHDSFGYDVHLISTKRQDFIALLQKILEPDPQPGDEAEVSEEIFTDTQSVTVSEENEVISAEEDTAQQVEVQ